MNDMSAVQQSNQIELGSLQHPDSPSERNHQSNDTNDGFSLPPTDGGKHAWLMLFSCFMLEALIWGMRLALGHLHSAKLLQAFHLVMESSKSIIARTSLLPGLVT
jgi:hypothetical protein